MPDVQIKYVTKSGNSSERITEVGGDSWRWPVHKVVESITKKTNTFYTFVKGVRANVLVVHATPKHIRTDPDKTPVDNLLSLPPFP